MSFWSNLVGGGIAEPIKAVGEIIDNVYTSEGEKLDKQQLLERLRQAPSMAQVDLNKTEAQHRTLFVAGWRPYIGWVCGTGLAMYFLPQYAMASILWTKLCWEAQQIVPYPVTPDALMELVIAMLGLGTLRTLEKFKGVTR